MRAGKGASATSRKSRGVADPSERLMRFAVNSDTALHRPDARLVVRTDQSGRSALRGADPRDVRAFDIWHFAYWWALLRGLGFWGEVLIVLSLFLAISRLSFSAWLWAKRTEGCSKIPNSGWALR